MNFDLVPPEVWWVVGLSAFAYLIYLSWRWYDYNNPHRHPRRQSPEEFTDMDSHVRTRETSTMREAYRGARPDLDPHQIQMALNIIRDKNTIEDADLLISAWNVLERGAEIYGSLVGSDRYRIIGKEMVTSEVHPPLISMWCVEHRYSANDNGYCLYPWRMASRISTFWKRQIVFQQAQAACRVIEVYILQREDIETVVAVESMKRGEIRDQAPAEIDRVDQPS